jgi:hypothetical protein
MERMQALTRWLVIILISHGGVIHVVQTFLPFMPLFFKNET